MVPIPPLEYRWNTRLQARPIFFNAARAMASPGIHRRWRRKPGVMLA
jgi:hypothetical protein